MAAFDGPELLVELMIAALGELNVLDCALIWEARLEAASTGTEKVGSVVGKLRVRADGLIEVNLGLLAWLHDQFAREIGEDAIAGDGTSE